MAGIDGTTGQRGRAQTPMSATEIELSVVEPLGVERRAWPVTMGVPFPTGVLADDQMLRLHREGTEQTRSVPNQQSPSLSAKPLTVPCSSRRDRISGPSKQVARYLLPGPIWANVKSSPPTACSLRSGWMARTLSCVSVVVLSSRSRAPYASSCGPRVSPLGQMVPPVSM